MQDFSSVFRVLDVGTMWQLAVLVVLAWVSIGFVQRALLWLGNQLSGRRRLSVLMLVPFVRLAIIVITLVLAVPLVIEPTLQNMWAILGSVGLAIGFALKDYASSLIAGIVGIGERNYRTGDWVRVGDVYGEVRHVGMRTLEVVTPDDDRVLIPHSLLWTQPVYNANNGDARLQCCAEFYLRADQDGHKAAALLEDVALTSPLLYAKSSVAVVVSEKPWGTQFRLKAYPMDARQQFQFTTDLTLRGKAALLQAGFDFASASALPAGH